MNPVPPSPNKTHAERNATFARLPGPGLAGVLEIRSGKTVSRYLVAGERLPDCWRLRLMKPDGTRYWVALADEPAECLCDCIGFLQYGRCRHVEGLSAIHAAGGFC